MNQKVSCLQHIALDQRNGHIHSNFQFYGNYTTANGNNREMIIIGTDIYGHSPLFDFDMKNINCKWYIYSGSNPLEVYSHRMKLLSENGTYLLFDTGSLCMCFDGVHPICYTGPIYPGQTLNITLSLNKKVVEEIHMPISVKANDEETPHSVCKVFLTREAEQEVHKT